VTGDVRKDYLDASLIVDMVPNASAALSRRCLQTLLEAKAGATKSDRLADQIKDVMGRTGRDALPSYIAENLEALRQFGNFGAHPVYDYTSGEIIPVEDGEAGWTLTVLEDLFDHYYVRPAAAAAKRAAAKAKADARKKPTT
jgi:hypothetical protein